MRGEKKLVTARMEQLIWLGFGGQMGHHHDTPGDNASPRPDGPVESEDLSDIIMMNQDVEMSGQVSALDCLVPPIRLASFLF